MRTFQRNLIPVVYTNIQESEPTGQDTCYHLLEMVMHWEFRI
ncbi:12959_t:CDS:2 [Rhizophagus irregularis]|nr:12959_t:CDS:2 [Rhizophagus irregularis]